MHHKSVRIKKSIYFYLLLLLALAASTEVNRWIPLTWLADLCTFLCFMAILGVSGRRLFTHADFPIPTGAMVMSFGVFVTDLFKAWQLPLPFIKSSMALIVCVWGYIFAIFIFSTIKGRFKKIHQKNRLGLFGIGTWVAATSVCNLGLFIFIKEWRPVAEVMTLLNTGLWLYYLFLSLPSLLKLRGGGDTGIHGIILLTTVSTESILIDYTTWLGSSLPKTAAGVLALAGIAFYLISAALIFSSLKKSASLAEGWPNTNCILHGALSITGVAMIKASLLPGSLLAGYWLIVAAVFLAVEIVEILRLIGRLKSLGWKAAVGHYDVSQWARTFTFSMFIAFTLNVPKGGILNGMIVNTAVTIIFPFLVLLILYESYLFISHMTKPLGGTQHEVQTTDR